MITYSFKNNKIKFSNSKIAYKNTLNNFFEFGPFFEEVMSKKPKFDIF